MHLYLDRKNDAIWRKLLKIANGDHALINEGIRAVGFYKHKRLFFWQKEHIEVDLEKLTDYILENRK